MNNTQETILGMLLLVCLPFVIYWLTWVLGRAWYAGRLSAIRRAFHLTNHLTKGKRPWSRKSGSNTDRERKTR
jgi:hypothetical protein